MDKNQRKKELKALYQEMKPEMGVIAARCKTTNRVFLYPCANLKAKLNRVNMFKELNFMLNSNLQKEIQQYGFADFEVWVAEQLEYEKEKEGEVPKTDYTEALGLLTAEIAEKLQAQGMALYE